MALLGNETPKLTNMKEAWRLGEHGKWGNGPDEASPVFLPICTSSVAITK